MTDFDNSGKSGKVIFQMQEGINFKTGCNY